MATARKDYVVNLVKVCVGISDVDKLERIMAAMPEDEMSAIVTRDPPVRPERIVGTGSLYWVIGGKIQARQLITAIIPINDPDRIMRCRVELDRRLVRTVAVPRRSFPDWRYLKDEQAPPDLAAGGDTPLPADLALAGLA